MNTETSPVVDDRLIWLAEVVPPEVFEKLEGDGSRSDTFYDARLMQINEDRTGQLFWLPREDSEQLTYDLFKNGLRQLALLVTEGGVEQYTTDSLVSSKPVRTFDDVSESVARVEQDMANQARGLPKPVMPPPNTTMPSRPASWIRALAKNFARPKD